MVVQTVSRLVRSFAIVRRRGCEAKRWRRRKELIEQERNFKAEQKTKHARTIQVSGLHRSRFLWNQDPRALVQSDQPSRSWASIARRTKTSP